MTTLEQDLRCASSLGLYSCSALEWGSRSRTARRFRRSECSQVVELEALVGWTLESLVALAREALEAWMREAFEAWR